MRISDWSSDVCSSDLILCVLNKKKQTRFMGWLPPLSKLLFRFDSCGFLRPEFDAALSVSNNTSVNSTNGCALVFFSFGLRLPSFLCSPDKCSTNLNDRIELTE